MVAARPAMAVDVLVVGLGPGGSSAALTAAQAGGAVLGIDRNAVIGEPVQCAEFIPRPMGAWAQDAGVLQQTVDGMKSYLPSGAVEESAFPGLMIDRAAFDRAIARRAREAGAELRTGTRLLELDPVAHSATLSDGNGEYMVHWRALVAADGPHSPCARLSGWAEQRTVQTRQYSVPLLQPYSDTDIWLSDDFPGGYAWLFPRGGVANLGLGIDKAVERDLKAPLEALHAELVARGLVGPEILARTGGAIPVGGLREALYSEGGPVVLVGDAAGLTHPITGAGISAAVVSGERAGTAVMAWLGGDTDALEDYDEDIRDQFEVTVQRGVARRQELDRVWRTPTAQEDGTMRRGWIAFDEYFAA